MQRRTFLTGLVGALLGGTVTRPQPPAEIAPVITEDAGSIRLAATSDDLVLHYGAAMDSEQLGRVVHAGLVKAIRAAAG